MLSPTPSLYKHMHAHTHTHPTTAHTCRDGFHHPVCVQSRKTQKGPSLTFTTAGQIGTGGFWFGTDGEQVGRSPPEDPAGENCIDANAAE